LERKIHKFTEGKDPSLKAAYSTDKVYKKLVSQQKEALMSIKRENKIKWLQMRVGETVSDGEYIQEETEENAVSMNQKGH